MSVDTDRLRRVERSLAELETDSHPARLKEGLLSALRRERDSLVAATERPDQEKPRRLGRG
jgi:hypothetical protein